MVVSLWRGLPPLLLLLCSACPRSEPGREDPGDYTDEGPFASCRYAGGGACGDLQGFDLSGCDPASLGAVDPDGIWTTHTRYPLPDGGADFAVANLTLRSDGGPERVDRGYPVTRKQVGGGTFYAGMDLSLPDGGTVVRAYAGCRAPAADQVVGCVVTCRNDTLRSTATFLAKKVQRLPGEPEAAGLTLLSESPARGTPVDVYVTKGHAYVVSVNAATGPGGLTVFDVRNPAAPVKTAELTRDPDSYWNGVWARGDALYVGSDRAGVLVFDISNPAQPQFVTSTPDEQLNVHTVFVRDTLLFAMGTNRDQVLIYDVTQPLSPRLRARYVAPDAPTTPGAYPHDSFAYEDRLYTFHWRLGTQIADISDPANPRPLGRYQYPRATSHAGAVGRFGDRLLLFEGGEDWGAHLRVLDVTNPADVALVGEWRLPPEVSIHNMVLDEAARRLSVAHYQHGVRVLDVSEPTRPVQVAHYNTWHPAQPGRGEDFYDGAIGIRRPAPPDVAEAGLLFVVDTTRGLLVLREP